MTAAEFKNRVMPFHRQLFALAYRLMGQAEDAEDVLQEAYLKMWSQRDRLPHELQASYLHAVVKNLCIDQLRARSLLFSDDDDAADTSTVSPEESPALLAERRDEASMALRLMEQLPPQQRLVGRLHDVEGFTYGEVASLTGLSETNVRVLLSRARKKLREQLLNMSKSNGTR